MATAAQIRSVYHRHDTQRVASDPNWRVNCTAYCASSAITDSVLGGLDGISGRLVRAMSSEPKPDPSSPGLNLAQIDAVCAKLRVPFTVKIGQKWATILDDIGVATNRYSQARAIVQVDYATLGAERCQANGDFGHAIVLAFGEGTRVYGSDPLCDKPRYYPAATIRKAAEVFGKQHGLATGGIYFGVTRAIPKRV